MDTVCDFPYLGTNCTTTYAEYIGKSYYIYHGLFIGLAISSFSFAFVQTCRSFYHSKIKNYRMQKMILFESLLMTIFLLIQSIDPLAYSGTLPPIVESFASNLTTYCGLVILFTIIIWTTNVYEMTYKINSFKSMYSCNFWNIINFITFILSIVFSIFQVHGNRSLVRGIKLISIGVITIVSTIKINYVLRPVVDSLKTLRNDESYRLRAFVFFLNIFSFFISVYQIVSGIVSLIEGSFHYPRISVDQITFPICEFIGVILAVCFMSKIKYDEETLFNIPSIRFPLIILPKINWEYFSCCRNRVYVENSTINPM